MAITTIVNTDTFNTWLVRTNQLITGQNSLETSNAVLAYANAISANATAIAAFTTANLAFTNANTTHTSLVNNWGATNAAFLAANTSFANGNINFVVTVSAFAKANAGVSDAANSSAIAIASFANGNTNFGTTVAAFQKANDAFSNTSGSTFNGTLKVSDSIDAAFINVTFQATNTKSSIVRFTTPTEFRTGTTNAAALTPAAVWKGAEQVELTDAATIAIDMNSGFNFLLEIAGNRTLGQPTNQKVGQSGVIRIRQDAIGGRTLSYHSDWVFAGGIDPTLSTTAFTNDLLFYQVVAVNYIFASLVKNVS